LGACTASFSEPGMLPGQCAKAAHEKGEWGQDATFFTCRPPPWGKCGIFGDPYILPFDIPADDTQCPTLRGELGTGMSTADEPGVYNLVKMPLDTGANVPLEIEAADLLVQGKFGYTKEHPTRSSLQGIAVSGAYLDDHKLVIEFQTSGSEDFDFSVKWDDEAVFTEGKDVFIDDATLPLVHAMRTTADTIYNDATTHLYVFKIYKAPSVKEIPPHQEFLRLFVELVGFQSLNTIITMQKSFSQDQGGLCGNFNCNPNDDSIEEMTTFGYLQNVSAADNLFTEYAARLPAMSGQSQTLTSDQTSLSMTKPLCSNVPSNLQMGCAKDAAHCKDLDCQAEVVKRYELFGTLWGSV